VNALLHGVLLLGNLTSNQELGKQLLFTGNE